jgi:hypothetical protein
MPLSELVPGQAVSWIYVPRGGYGFSTPVDAVVVKVGKARVRIEVSLRNGRRVQRFVKPESLRSRYQ